MKDKIFKNAVDFNQKGMKYYVEEDIKHSLLNVAVAVELLGKAFLMGLNPCLIVDRDFDSLLHICGLGKHARKSPSSIRTIGAKEVFSRCAQIIPKLMDYEVEMGLLSNFRSGVLHLADHEKEFTKKVFLPYLKVTKILLENMNISLKDYFGEFEKLAEASIEEASKEVNIKVERLIAKAKISFKERFDGAEEAVKNNIIKSITGAYVLTKYEEELVSCPVCDCDAILMGSFEVERWEADFDEYGNAEGAYPIVKLHASGFKCNVCGLRLDTSEELESANIETTADLQDIDPADFYDPDPPPEFYEYEPEPPSFYEPDAGGDVVGGTPS